MAVSNVLFYYQFYINFVLFVYNNISHFNRQLKLIKGLSAKAYAKKYMVHT
jgi:hypothetical protein